MRDIGMKLSLYILLAIFIAIVFSCDKEIEPPIGQTNKFSIFDTLIINNITDTSAEIEAKITNYNYSPILEKGVCWSTSKNPTIIDSHTTDGSGTGSFTSYIVGLEPNTIYYVRVYATKNEGTGYGSDSSFTSQFNFTGSFTDSRDGNSYQTIKISGQVWMAENLKYLPDVVGPDKGSETISYCYVYGYDGNDVNDAKATTYYDTYGVLYNWQAAMNGSVSSSSNPSDVQGICPDGWHLPSDAEWTELATHLGGESIAGVSLREKGTTHWSAPNEGATNTTGFTGLPGGNRLYSNIFGHIGNNGFWWSSTAENNSKAWGRAMSYGTTSLGRTEYGKGLGFSVRCIKDN